MVNDSEKITIVGSGPVGLVAALDLLRRGKKVEVLDIGIESETVIDKEIEKKYKKYLGSIHPYDNNEYLKFEFNQKNEGLTSKSKFGFSIVWGAVWRKDTDMSPIIRELDEIVLEGLIHEVPNSNRFRVGQAAICSCISISENTMENEIKYEIPILAISEEECVWSGKCQNGCSFGAIWTSEILLKACITYKSFEYKSSVFVEKFKSDVSGIFLTTNIGILQTDKLILATGPVGNVSILLRSKILNEMHLKDTQAVFNLYFCTNKLIKHKKQFGLSTLSSTLTLEDYKIYTQFYPHIENSIERINDSTPRLVRPIAGLIIRMLKNRMIIGLTLLDPSMSGSLKFSIDSDKIYCETRKNPRQKNFLKSYRKQLNQNVKLSGLYQIPAVQKLTKVGESYHLGAAYPRVWNEYGQLLGDKRIGLAGAAGLEVLEPGPITVHAMAQGLILSRQF